MGQERHGRDEHGFTLVELLVVIVIIGILAALVVFGISNVTDRGQDSACKADERALVAAMETYLAKNGSYPTDEAALVPDYIRRPSKHYGVGPGGTVVPKAGGNCA